IANGDYYESACPGFVYTNNVSYNDQQLNSPSYTLVALPNNGTIDLDPDGEFIYTPNSTFCGTDQFTYSVCNQYSNCCDTASVVIDLSDPEAPVLNGIPTDIIVHCDEEIPLPPLVEAYENCQSVTIGLDQVTTQGNDSCSIYSYDLTRIWTGLDYCGNSAVDQQQISIQDLTAPDIFRVYTLPNGKQMVAGVMENVTQRWKTVGFPVQFAFPPVVFAQVTSRNENSAVVTRLRNVSTTQFQLRLQEEENADGAHLEENVAWIAIDQGSWSGSPSGGGGGSPSGAGGVPFEVTRRLTNSTAVAFPLAQSYPQPPCMIGSIQTFNENNPGAMRFSSVTGSHATTFIQEEKSLDPEVLHGFETVGYLALGGTGDVKTASGEVVGEVGSLTIDHNFQTVTFQHVYHNPVVVLGGLTYDDIAPATVRVQNVTPTGFSVQ
ncbi:MAG: Ig-like domain-containing protein, partial [Bacteroidota bacterium]